MIHRVYPGKCYVTQCGAVLKILQRPYTGIAYIAAPLGRASVKTIQKYFSNYIPDKHEIHIFNDGTAYAEGELKIALRCVLEISAPPSYEESIVLAETLP